MNARFIERKNFVCRFPQNERCVRISSAMRKIFLTGHKGYIGVELIPLLRRRGYTVIGCDTGLFEECAWYPAEKADRDLNLDLRDISPGDLLGCDAVIHLAALSNDPMGDLDPELTREVNLKSSIRLANMAKEAGVSRFLFAGSCSVYGKGDCLDLNETAPLNPLTPYAESKIEAEREILALCGNGFATASLRNATAYGSSAMLRLDLVVNNLMACAYTQGNICLKSDGTSWRPLIHCRDIARAFVAFLEAPKEAVSGQAVNIGANEENYQVKDVARLVQEMMPGADIVFTGEIGHDPRNYRVNFDRLNRLLPGFRLRYTLREGMRELLNDFRRHGLPPQDFEGGKYVRLEKLKETWMAPA